MNTIGLESKIAIHSVPRAGSSWLGQIFNSSPNVNFIFQPLFSYTFKSFLNENSSQNSIYDFFNKIAISDDDFLTQKENIRNGKYPRFLKKEPSNFVVYKEVRYHNILKNMIAKTSDVKLVCLVRNPIATIDDWLNTPREFRKDLGWNEIEEWRFAKKKNWDRPEEFNGYEKWKEATNIFEYLQKKYPERVCIVEYKKLLENSLQETQRIFNFCGIELENQTINFLSESNKKHNNDPYSVYKSITEDTKWKNSLNPLIANEILKDLIQSSLKKYL